MESRARTAPSIDEAGPKATDMAEGPTLSDFMRHLQAVLEESTDIPDAKEQQHRQWQIEAAIQEAIIFGNRYQRTPRARSGPVAIGQTKVE